MSNQVVKNRRINGYKRLKLYSPLISELDKRFPKKEGAQIEIDTRDYDLHTLTAIITSPECKDKLIILKDFDPIPEEWKEEVIKQGKKLNQCEIVKHATPYEVKIENSPLKTFSKLFKNQERDPNFYPYFTWRSYNSSRPDQAFRMVELFEAYLMKFISEIIGEEIKIGGSHHEVYGKVPSRSQKELGKLLRKYQISEIDTKDINYQEVVITGFKRKDEDFYDWHRIEPYCSCWINKLDLFHYKHGYCPHSIAVMDEAAMKMEYIQIFPRITDEALMDYFTIRFQVIKKNKDPKTGRYRGRKFLTTVERDILLQCYLDNKGKGKVFDFSYPNFS